MPEAEGQVAVHRTLQGPGTLSVLGSWRHRAISEALARTGPRAGMAGLVALLLGLVSPWPSAAVTRWHSSREAEAGEAYHRRHARQRRGSRK